METKVVKLYESVAFCPKCDGQLWRIHLDGLRQDYQNITSHECGGCGFRVDFKFITAAP